jgi:hypothetical protein
MRRAIPAVLPLLLVSVFCRYDSEVPERTSASRRVETKQPEDEEFKTPPDGKLVARQVEMYITVQRRALELAGESPLGVEEKPAVEKLADLATADLRAAVELGYDTNEYRWVKEKVIEAGLGIMADSLDSSMKVVESASLQGLENLRGETTSREEPARLDEEVAGAKADERAALTHNRRLLEQYREQLAALESAKAPLIPLLRKPED